MKQSWFFEKINKIDKLLPKLTGRDRQTERDSKKTRSR